MLSGVRVFHYRTLVQTFYQNPRCPLLLMCPPSLRHISPDPLRAPSTTPVRPQEARSVFLPPELSDSSCPWLRLVRMPPAEPSPPLTHRDAPPAATAAEPIFIRVPAQTRTPSIPTSHECTVVERSTHRHRICRWLGDSAPHLQEVHHCGDAGAEDDRLTHRKLRPLRRVEALWVPLVCAKHDPPCGLERVWPRREMEDERVWVGEDALGLFVRRLPGSTPSLGSGSKVQTFEFRFSEAVSHTSDHKVQGARRERGRMWCGRLSVVLTVQKGIRCVNETDFHAHLEALQVHDAPHLIRREGTVQIRVRVQA